MPQPQPKWLQVVPEEIPDELKTLRHWVCWRAALRDEKWTKIPYRPNGTKADVTDETTWTTFERCMKAYISEGFQGVGFVLTAEDPYTFVDLDRCVSIDGDRIEGWASEYVSDLNSYTEVSPSGTGLRIVVKAKLPASGRREGPVELYDDVRFCTFTGVKLEHTPDVEERQEAIDRMHQAIFGHRLLSRARGQGDAALIEQAKDAKNGAKFSKLWDGDFSEFGSQSEADQSLADSLVYWTEGDTLRADRLFRASGLMREKWDSKRGTDTYGSQTIANALALWRQNQKPVAAPRVAKVTETAEGAWTTARLLQTHFPDLQWIVDELIPEEALTILGGKKKVGKSWLARQIAGAVSSGDAVLGRKTLRGKVLFFCLEDGKRRLRRRLQMQDASEEEDTEYAFKDELDPLDAGGDEQLRERIRKVRPILVVIDTLAAAKSGKIDENAAGPMADLINNLQQMCQQEHTAILLIAHHGKSSFGDSGHDIRGSSAIAAAADVNLALYHKMGDVYTLTAEGRDIAEGEYRLDFEEFRFKMRGDEKTLSAIEAATEVLEMLVQLGETSAMTVATQLGRSRQGTIQILNRLVKIGKASVRSDRVAGQAGRPQLVYKANPDAELDRYDLRN